MLQVISRLLARLFGFSGKHSLSAECGASECRFCKWLCGRVLNDGHCERQARREGLIS